MTAPRRRPPWRVAAALALLAPLGGCVVPSGDSPAQAAATTAATTSAGTEPALRVVTTVAPLTSIVAAVAGDRAKVDGLVPEGTNSHTFEPPPSAARVLSEADVVFLNGLRLEEPTKKLAAATMADDARLVELGDAVLPEPAWIYDFSFPREDGKPNPHLWTDPTYAIRYAAEVRRVLAVLDPAGADTYAANHAAFERQATGLADALRADQESLPPDRRELLTYHDAYAYFARTFGWRVIGAVQPKDFAEPTAKDIARLIDQIRAEGVPAVFGSEVFPSRALAEIGRATGAAYEDTLRDDDLPGAPGDAEHSWLGLMRYDYRTILSRLGGRTTSLDAVDVTPPVPDRAHYPQ